MTFQSKKATKSGENIKYHQQCMKAKADTKIPCLINS